MDEEEKPDSPGRFRVVDKRISSRPDAPTESGSEAPSEQPPASSPSPAAPPPTAPEPPVEATPVAPQTPPGGPAAPPGGADPAGPVPQPGAGGDEQIWTPEQEAEARAFVEEIAQRPSLEWVVNTAVTLANVAGTKLDLGRTADAELAIDALAALVEKLGTRLDQAEAPLRQTLAQLQLAYAQRSSQPPPAGGEPGAGATP